MNLFDNVIDDLRDYLQRKKSDVSREYAIPRLSSWPIAGKGNVVLEPDTAIELGNPRDESASFMLWSNDAKKINDGRMTLIGPDIGDPKQKNLPFGKVVLLGVREMTEDNCYERHRELEMARYDLNLSGYMMRSVSQYGREWSRVSKKAISQGMNFATLGSALAQMYRNVDFVESVEIVFVTSSPADVRELGVLGDKASRLIGALNKMAAEMSFECDSCEFVDVCDEVEDLRNIRNNLKKEETNVRR